MNTYEINLDDVIVRLQRDIASLWSKYRSQTFSWQCSDAGELNKRNRESLKRLMKHAQDELALSKYMRR